MPAYEKADEISGIHAWAWGRHVAAGHKVQKITTGSGTDAVTTLVVLLGQGAWEGIEAAYFGGTLIDPANYHFHRGYLSTSMAESDDPDVQGVDSWNIGGQTYSGTAYVVIRLPAGVTSDDDISKLEFICKTRRVPDFNADGTQKVEGQLDSEGQVLGKNGLSFSTNPARVMADLLLNARGLSASRINWTAWVAWRDFCNVQIAWVGGEKPGRPNFGSAITNIIVGADSRITKPYGIPPTGWNGGARTQGSIPNATTNGYFEWDAGVGTHACGLTLGIPLGDNGAATSNTHLKYGLQCQAGGQLRLLNDGLDLGVVGSWAMGDRFRVGWRLNGVTWQPYFQKNGVDIDTSALTITGWNGATPLYGGAAFYTQYSEILRSTFAPVNGGARTRKRFECSLAFASATDVTNAIEAILFVSCSHFQQADGKFVFLPPPMVESPRPAPLNPNGTSLAFSMDNISTSSFKTYRLSPDQRPTRFKAIFRDADNEYLEEANVEVLRETLADQLGRHKDAPELFLGTITRAQALCVMHFHARMMSDLDLFAKFDASGETWSALPADILPVSHDVPGWNGAKMMVIDAEDYSGMETADKRGFVVQLMPQDNGLYSDDDQRPLVVTLPVTTLSILSTPPPVTILSLTQDSAHGVNNTFVTKVRGRVQFGNFGASIQRARVYVTRPGDVEKITNLILTPDAVNQDEFEFTPTISGTYTFRIESMNEIGLHDKLITHPSQSIPVGNVVLTLPVPVTPTARYMAGSVVYNWFRPLTNPERVNRAELRRDNGTTTAPDLTDAGLVYEGDATSAVENFLPPMPVSITRWIRFKDDMGNASSWIKIAGAAIPVVDIPAVSGFDFIYFGGNEVLANWTALDPSYSIAEYQISTQNGVSFESNIVARDMSNKAVIYLTAGASRTQGYYIRAVDTFGNKGAISTLATKTFAAPTAPTISLDATAQYPSSFKLRINPGSVSAATVKRTVIHVRNNIGGTPLLYDLEFDGMVESAIILGRPSTPNVIITVEYQDFFSSPYNVSGSVTYAFTQFLGTDIANNAIGVNHIQDNILTTAKFASSIRPVQLYSASTTVLPTLPDSNYPDGAVINWTNAATLANRGLWTNRAGTWSNDVAGSSITGTIPTAAIAAGAIGDTQLNTASNFYKTTQSNMVSDLSGGATVSYSVGNALTWSYRLISIPNALSSDGHISIDAHTATNIVFSTWESLFYRFRIGASSTNDSNSGSYVNGSIPTQGLFKIGYSSYVPPPNGYYDFLVAHTNSEEGTIILWDKRVLKAGQTIQTADIIANDSIVSRYIAAAQIDTAHLKAGIITAEKLAVGVQPGNLIGNGSFENGIEGWAAIYSTHTPGIVVTGVSAPDGEKAVSLGTTGTNSIGSRAIPVQEGVKYVIRFKARCTGVANLDVAAYERTTAPASGYIDANGGSSTAQTSQLIKTGALSGGNTWTTYVIEYVPSTSYRWFSLVIYNVAGATGTFYIDGIEMVRMVGNTYIEGGSITTDKITATGISGTVITAGTMSADRIVANKGIVASQIAAGAISATEIAAKAIRVEQLAVGLGDNLVLNPGFDVDLNADGSIPGWQSVWTTGMSGAFSRAASSVAPGGYEIQVASPRYVGGRRFAIDDTLKYAVRLRVAASTGAAGLYFGFQESTASEPSGDYINQGNYTSVQELLNNGSAAGIGSANTYVTLNYVYTPSAGTKWATLRLGITGGGGTLYIGGVEVRAQIGTAFIQDAAITNVKIVDATITNAKILSLDAEKLTAAVGRIGLLLPTQVISADYSRHQPGTSHAETSRWRGFGTAMVENDDFSLTRILPNNSATTSAYGHRALFFGDGSMAWNHIADSHYYMGITDVRYGYQSATSFPFAGWHNSTTGGGGNGNMYTMYNGAYTDMSFVAVADDEFKIEVISATNTINWYRNGIILRTVTSAAIVYPIYPVGYQQLATKALPAVMVNGFITDTIAPPIVFENFLNVSVDAANVATNTNLVHTSASYATGVEQMQADAGGSLEWKVYNTDAGQYVMGFLYASDTISATTEYTNIRWGWLHNTSSAGYTGDNLLYIYENGTAVVSSVSAGDGVQVRIERVKIGTTWYIQYRRSGTLIRQVSLGTGSQPALRAKFTPLGIGAKVRNPLFTNWNSEGKGWKFHPRQGSDQIGVIESNDGFLIKNASLNEISARSLQAITQDLTIKASDTGRVVMTKPLSLDIQQYSSTWESNVVRAYIRFSMTNALTDLTCNCQTADLMRVRAYNMHGDVIREVEFPCSKGTGGGEIIHTRDFADPRQQAVYSVEIRNYAGYSQAVWYSMATDHWLNGVFNNRGFTPPTWANRNNFATNVKSESIDNSTVRMTWTPAVNGGTQTIYYRAFSVDGRNGWQAVSNEAAGVATKDVTGLSPNTRYEFMIDGVVGWSWSPISYTRTLPTALAAPTRSAPSGLSLSSNSAGTTITASWTRNATDNTGTTFEYRNVTDNGSWTAAMPGQVTTTSFSSTTGKVYEARVKNTWGSAPLESGYSNLQQVTANTAPPAGATPVSLVETAHDLYSVSLSWQANGGSNPYIEYYRDGVTAWLYNTTPASGATSVTIGGLSAGTTWYFRVRNGSPTTSGWSNTVIATTNSYIPPDPDLGCVVHKTPITIVGVGGMEGIVRADEVEPGMRAVSIDQNGNKIIGTIKGVFTASTSRIFTFVTENGKELTCSPSHPMVMATGEVRHAHALLNGDAVMVYNENTVKAESSKIVSVEYIDIQTPVLIFEMENAEHTFISGGIVSHNREEK